MKMWRSRFGIVETFYGLLCVTLFVTTLLIPYDKREIPALSLLAITLPSSFWTYLLGCVLVAVTVATRLEWLGDVGVAAIELAAVFAQVLLLRAARLEFNSWRRRRRERLDVATS